MDSGEVLSFGLNTWSKGGYGCKESIPLEKMRLARSLGIRLRSPYSIGRGEVCAAMGVDEQDLEDREQDLDALLQKLLGVPGSYAIVFEGDRTLVKWRKRR
jgi:hypothetical protein